MSRASAIMVSLSLATVGCGASTDELRQKLNEQVAMPSCSSVLVEEIHHKSIGIQDYEKQFTVGADQACLKQWQSVLQVSDEYNCEGTPTTCTRYDEARRYTEEWATVTFVGPRQVTVRLTKI